MSTTTNLSNSVRARYINQAILAAKANRVYDLFAMPISKDKEVLQNSSSVVVPYVGGMAITAQAIDETVDIPPQNVRDATASITPTSRGDGIQDSEKLLDQNYNKYSESRFEIIGENMVETLEALAIDTALAGSLVQRAADRASLDAGTSTHRLTDDEFFMAGQRLKEMRCPSVMQDGLKVPSGHIAAMHGDTYFDILQGGNINSILKYQDKEILFSGEVGELGGFRLIVSPFAKVFGGAGLDNGTDAGYTLSAAANSLATSLSVTTGTNCGSGRYLTLGTEETASTFYPENERVSHVSGTTTSVVVGGGANGGIRYDHASGTGVRNADSVYPVLFGGPHSIAKIYAVDHGEYGEIVGPNKTGNAEQFVSLFWKWYGAYAIMNQNW
ncbi:MAG: N4-gp56 family major capsid protein, partial [Kiritimatiellae bacterium]|nr:N4-gp56 family major capsid protein [Kiritimatiellia bacterium]